MLNIFSKKPINIPMARELSIMMNLEIPGLEFDAGKRLREDVTTMRTQISTEIQDMYNRACAFGIVECTDYNGRRFESEAIVIVEAELRALGYSTDNEPGVERFSFSIPNAEAYTPAAILKLVK